MTSLAMRRVAARKLPGCLPEDHKISAGAALSPKELSSLAMPPEVLYSGGHLLPVECKATFGTPSSPFGWYQLTLLAAVSIILPGIAVSRLQGSAESRLTTYGPHGNASGVSHAEPANLWF